MEITIDDAIETIEYLKTQNSQLKSLDVAADTMRKYQKIEDIYYHQSGEALENSLRSVIEDGNDTTNTENN